MQMRGKRRWSVALCLLAAAASGTLEASGPKKPVAGCRAVVLEASVRPGQAFEAPFATGLRFLLEPLASGWLVRVLADGRPRESHDFAELATPPYRSVSPLLVSTDWAFRAQDAVAWNPRHFRFAANDKAFRALEAQYDGAMHDDPKSMATVARLATEQPEGTLVILDAKLTPGTADQSRMASTVALHFSETPHTVTGVGASRLGRLEEMRFRVELEVPAGAVPASGATLVNTPCSLRPTAASGFASER